MVYKFEAFENHKINTLDLTVIIRTEWIHTIEKNWDKIDTP